MKAPDLTISDGGLLFIGLYLLAMLALGWFGKLKRKEESLRDFYLGGSSFGFFVLFLTLFATQYSGNTFLGFAGHSYRQGASYVVSVTFMILVITVYLIYAPRLFRLSRKFGYITPSDYIYHRFGSQRLRILSISLLCWGLANYILEQLVAIGHAVEAISAGRITMLIVSLTKNFGLARLVHQIEESQLDFMAGVVLLVGIMLIYESLGGMRSVAWTDVIQGLLLLAGSSWLLFLLLGAEGGLANTVGDIQRSQPAKLQIPDTHGLRVWASNLILVGFGVSIYPHAIQRIFAARCLRTLRISLAAMAFMPLVTTLLAFLIGFQGLSRFPALNHLESDKITIYMLSSLGDNLLIGWLAVVFLTGLVAAIMSTADSALLTIGSIITKDVYQAYINRNASPRRCLLVGKLFGWALMALLVLGAYLSLKTESSLWLLIQLKLEFLVQLCPVFVLGVHWRRLTSGAAFAGMLLGTLITLVMWLGALWDSSANRSPLGISAGVWGLAANYLVCILGGLLGPDGMNRIGAMLSHGPDDM